MQLQPIEWNDHRFLTGYDKTMLNDRIIMVSYFFQLYNEISDAKAKALNIM